MRQMVSTSDYLPAVRRMNTFYLFLLEPNSTGSVVRETVLNKKRLSCDSSLLGVCVLENELKEIAVDLDRGKPRRRGDNRQCTA